MTSKSILPILTALTLGLGAATQSQAAIVVTLPTAVAAGSIDITNDISFTVTTAGGFQIIVLDEWVTSDGAVNGFGASAFSPSSWSYSINGGATLARAMSAFPFADNLGLSVGAVTANDGFLEISPPLALAVGDVFTLKAATYVIAANTLPANFNPQAGQTFTGNAFLSTSSGTRQSANTPVGAIPEPGTALLGALAGGMSLLGRRRRH